MKSKKLLARILSVVLCIAIVAPFLVACGPDGNDPMNYTYNSYMASSPTTWNPHTWQTDADSYILSYITDGFYSQKIQFNEDGSVKMDGDLVAIEYECDMAVEMPKDVTSQFAGKYGVPAGTTEGYAFQVKLRDDLIWEDGTPIKPSDYYESMKLLLDPTMMNYRTNTFVTGVAAIAGAKNYVFQGGPVMMDAVDENYVLQVPADDINYFSFKNDVPFFGGNFYELYYTKYAPSNWTRDGVDLYLKWQAKADIYNYIEITPANRAEVIEDLRWLSARFGDTNPNCWYEWSFYWNGVDKFTSNFETDVGIEVSDTANTVTYIYAAAMTKENMMMYISNDYLVNVELYKKGFKTLADGFKGTDYYTSLETTMSFGPYKLQTYQKDKEFILVKNENWYGHKIAREEAWQTTSINIQIIPSTTTQMLEFKKGNLDTVALQAADMQEFGGSSNLIYTSSHFAMRIYLTSDRTVLSNIERDTTSQNIHYLANHNFRKAISLAINRAEYVRYTAGNAPGYVLLNDVYFYDYDNNKLYRPTKWAKQSVLDLYGLTVGAGETLDSVYNSITGYDREAARALFAQAYAEENAETISKGNNGNIVINVGTTVAGTETLKTRFEYIQTCLSEATKGTGLEGKITVQLYGCSTPDNYALIRSGKLESIYGASNGYTAYPDMMLGSIAGVVDPTGSPAYTPGFKANTIQVEIDLTDVKDNEHVLAAFADDAGFKANYKVTRDLEWWLLSFRAGNAFEKADLIMRAVILPRCELAMLNQFNEIPVAYNTTASLYSKQISYLLPFEDIKAGRGGLIYIKYNFTDMEWDKIKGTLDYRT